MLNSVDWHRFCADRAICEGAVDVHAGLRATMNAQTKSIIEDSLGSRGYFGSWNMSADLHFAGRCKRVLSSSSSASVCSFHA